MIAFGSNIQWPETGNFYDRSGDGESADNRRVKIDPTRIILVTQGVP